jgi:uncharacterized protein (TIGR03437 family)
MRKVTVIRTCFLVAAGAALAAAQTPVVKSVQNAASNTPAGLPNSGIAQGSLIAIYGSNLGPATISIAPGIPWPATLSGTSATVTVGSQTVNVLLYYTVAGQVAGLLPSNTPVGSGTLKVTYNNQTSAAAPVTVIQNGVGIFTWSQNGSGEAILTFPDYSVVTTGKAANPGDTLSVWATGLGPVSGNEAGVALPGDMPSIPVKVWVGGKSADVAYRGRSGCCVAEDQIAFVVPSGPVGCAVPLVIQINNYISNTTFIPVATDGRVCKPTNAAIPSDTLQKLLGKSQVSVGGVIMSRSTSVTPGFTPGLPATTNKSDDGSASFVKINISGDQLAAVVDTASIGSCLVSVLTSQTSNPFTGLTYTSLDAGASIGISGPAGSRTLAKSTAGGFTVYSAKLGDTSPGNYLDAGTYTVTGPGGADIGSFSSRINIPAPLVWTNQANITAVNRASGVTVNWTGGDPSSTVQITGSSYLSDISGNFVGASFTCQAPVSALSFTVPPAVLLALPPSGQIAGISIPGSLGVSNSPSWVTINATGLDYGYIASVVSNSIGVPYQ